VILYLSYGGLISSDGSKNIQTITLLSGTDWYESSIKNKINYKWL